MGQDRLEKYYQVKIVPEETLIIFDEIQMCERALTSLKYFAEEAPEYHVMAAGSLLGVAVNREKYSFPVGKVQMLTMYPMDLEEVLWAKGKQILSDTIREHYNSNVPLEDALHEEAMQEFEQMHEVHTGILYSFDCIKNEWLSALLLGIR